ncbi:unnamed protein product, partial [Ectocarpus sp. 12 AP-2014]
MVNRSLRSVGAAKSMQMRIARQALDTQLDELRPKIRAPITKEEARIIMFCILNDIKKNGPNNDKRALLGQQHAEWKPGGCSPLAVGRLLRDDRGKDQRDRPKNAQKEPHLRQRVHRAGRGPERFLRQRTGCARRLQSQRERVSHVRDDGAGAGC